MWESTRSTVGRARTPWRWLALLLLVGLWIGQSGPVLAQCLPVASAPPAILPAAHRPQAPGDLGMARAPIRPAVYRPAALPAAGSLRLTYLGHSSFRIESAAGVTAITDYNGVVGTADVPRIVTMNNAHNTHYTDFPDPEIEHVLRGWDPAGGVAQHALTVDDLHVRNVPTNVRDLSGVRYAGNSIFVFELADLCIAHLGHLHHVLSDIQLAELGMIDVLLVPIDGSYTIAQELMLQVLQQIAAAVIIPMHVFSEYTLARFLGLVEGRYEVVFAETPTVTLSRATLPYRKVLVLPGS